MNKKIAAVAVAGLFAAPSIALAQSSVTISGQFKTSFENLKIGNYTTGGLGTGARAVGSGNDSSYGLTDDSSRIIFNVREDLGGGLAAIGQLDIRVKPDDTQGAGQPNGNIAQGNSHVGLQSKSWGQIIFGRQDLHYFNTSGNISGKNSLRADSISMLGYAGAFNLQGSPVGGGTAIAGTTRTQNVIRYLTPNWGGFTGIIAYSSNPQTTDADIGNTTTSDMRRGYAWNLNPNYAAANWQVGYSYWKSKPDAGNTAITFPGSSQQLGGSDQRAHRLYGHYVFGFGLKVGLAWDHSKLEGNNDAVLGGDGYTYAKRTVWSIPFQYSFMGKHQITGHYTWAKKDTGDASDDLGLNNTKANMWAIGYSYDLSKRTSLGVTYARINNQSNAGYTFFTQASLGLASGGIMAGEDPRLLSTTIRHAF